MTAKGLVVEKSTGDPPRNVEASTKLRAERGLQWAAVLGRQRKGSPLMKELDAPTGKFYL